MKRIIPSFFACAFAVLFAASCGKKNTPAADLKWEKASADSLTFSWNQVLRDDWMALAVCDKDSFNAMTIGWGTAGRLWNKPVMIVYVSEDRYTKALMDSSAYFTVSLFPEENHEALVYLGSHTGAKEPDKVQRAGLTPEFTSLGNPIFAEAILYIECKKLYATPFDPEEVPEDVRQDIYKRVGIHTMYIGEIVNVMRKKIQ